jgi:hypothetical protein
MAKGRLQTLGSIGGGRPPGYEWNVVSLSEVHSESEKLLTTDERQHIADLAKQLATEDDPTHSVLCDVRKVEEFYELRDSGGPLGGKNVRLFFGVAKEGKSLVLLGLILKQNNGPTPPGDKIRIRRRWRKYQAGDYT